jgi:hypothetical protein
MNIQEARAAIEGILASIPDSDLPKFDKVEVKEDGETCVWFGGLGHVLGRATRNGERHPLLHRGNAARNAIQGEMVYRTDKRFLENGDKPHGINLAKRTVLR